MSGERDSIPVARQLVCSIDYCSMFSRLFQLLLQSVQYRLPCHSQRYWRLESPASSLSSYSPPPNSMFSTLFRFMLLLLPTLPEQCKLLSIVPQFQLTIIIITWKALQILINSLYQCANIINMTCNANKTVCMIFKPKCKRLIVASNFP